MTIDSVPVYVFRRQGSWRYKISWDLSRWLERNVRNYDLLHIHAVFSFSTAAAACYARRHRVPYIMLPHGMLGQWPVRKNRLIKTIYLKGVEQNNIENAAAVHFTAQDEFRTSLLRGRSNFVLPYVINLVPVAERDPPLESKSKLRILYLSRLDPKKGIDLLLGAVSKLAGEARAFELVVAGSGDPAYQEQVKAMIGNMHLSEITKLVGFVDGAEKESLLKSADMFVLSSYDENFGIAVAEAMAASLPVIVTDRVNIHEEIQKGGAGLVVLPTIDAVCTAIRKMLDDPELRVSMGQRGSQLVANKFAPVTITQDTLQVYQDVIHNSRRSRCWVTASN
jgi:glycosyltransferase involved in cell wall biosynthesis